MVKKTCVKCGVAKPLSEFGVTSRCKECIRKYNRRYYEKNRKAIIAHVTKKRHMTMIKAGKHYWWSL